MAASGFLRMVSTASQHYSIVTEYGGVAASFPALRSRKGVDDPCVSQT
jgi:hypothetical protein